MITSITLTISQQFQELLPQYRGLELDDARVKIRKDSIVVEFDEPVEPADLASKVEELCEAIDNTEVE